MSMKNPYYKELKRHVGHKIVCVIYGKVNVSVECETCFEVLRSEDKVAEIVDTEQ